MVDIKKLRNRIIKLRYEKIKPSNINTPIIYINFLIIYKFGSCGVKLNILRRYKYNEIL